MNKFKGVKRFKREEVIPTIDSGTKAEVVGRETYITQKCPYCGNQCLQIVKSKGRLSIPKLNLKDNSKKAIASLSRTNLKVKKGIGSGLKKLGERLCSS